MSADLFISSSRASGDLGGIVEYDGDTTYFYLYSNERPEGSRVLGSILIAHGLPAETDDAIDIRWSPDEEVVGLFIDGQLCAAFDARTHRGFGGRSVASSSPAPAMPAMIRHRFGTQ